MNSHVFALIKVEFYLTCFLLVLLESEAGCDPLWVLQVVHDLNIGIFLTLLGLVIKPSWCDHKH